MISLLLFLAADPVAETDALFAPFGSTKPGCVAGIVRNGKTVFAKGYGTADIEQNTPLTAKSVFYLASVSKQSMAFAILLLEKQGKLSIDDAIGKYVEGLPTHTAAITLRQLLHHTSGVRDYLMLGGLAGLSQDHVWTEHGALATIKRQKALNFAPGSEFSYSNSGYVLLSLAAQKAIGGKLDPWMRDNVWKPLGMAQSRWQHDHRDPIPSKAHGYVNGPKIADSMLDVVGDGGMYASLDDLLRWAANFDTRKLGGELLDRMRQPGPNAGNYGMGLSTGKYRGHETVSHGGSLAGYRTMLFRIPSMDFTAVCLCNDGGQNAGTFANRLADIWLKVERGWNQLHRQQGSVLQTPPVVRFKDTNRSSEYLGTWRSEELDAVYKIGQSADGSLTVEDPSGRIRALAATNLVFWLNSLDVLLLSVGRVHGIELRRLP